LEAASATEGRYVAATAAFAVALLGVVYLEDSGFSAGWGILLVFVFGAIYVGLLIAFLLKLIWRIFRGPLRSALAPLFCLCILAAVPFLLQMSAWLFDLARLYSSIGVYRAAIAQTPPDANGNKFLSFNWGGGGFVGHTWDKSLIYIERPDRTLPDSGEKCTTDRHLIGGFYTRTHLERCL
jgi:hypothetical protein